MNTQASNSPENLELTIRRLRTLWVGILGSFVAFYLVTILSERPEDAEPNDTLFLIFAGIALTTTVASFIVKKKFFDRAVEQQKVELVQQGLVVASMLTEVAALLGTVNYFLSDNRYYYVLFIIAVCGQLLHFPRREHVLNASFHEKADGTVGYGL